MVLIRSDRRMPTSFEVTKANVYFICGHKGPTEIVKWKDWTWTYGPTTIGNFMNFSEC